MLVEAAKEPENRLEKHSPLIFGVQKYSFVVIQQGFYVLTYANQKPQKTINNSHSKPQQPHYKGVTGISRRQFVDTFFYSEHTKIDVPYRLKCVTYVRNRASECPKTAFATYRNCPKSVLNMISEQAQEASYIYKKRNTNVQEERAESYLKRKETQLKEGRGYGKGCPQGDWKAVTSYLPIQTSGFNLAVSLRSWKWRTQLPSPSSFTVPRISRALTFCPLATMTEERLQ